MASDPFFSLSPQSQTRRATINFGFFPQYSASTSNGDTLASRSLNQQLPVTPSPPRQGSKTLFRFKSPTPVLFASPQSSYSLSGSAYSPVTTPQKKGKGKEEEGVLTPPRLPSRRPDLGYFAFPAGSPPPFLGSDSGTATVAHGVSDYDGSSQSAPPMSEGSNGVSFVRNPKHNLPPASVSANAPPCTSHKSRTPVDCGAQPRPSPSRLLEQAEAERGEEEWVSIGGVLRNRFGIVDVERTQRVREEVERKKREKVLRERWEAYEEGWRKLVERCGGPGGNGKAKARDNEEERKKNLDVKDVSFNDVPWPVWIDNPKEMKPKFVMSMSANRSSNDSSSRSQASSISGNTGNRCTLQHLTLDRIEDFLLTPLGIRGNAETPKNRVRRSYLRWHPDKLGWLFDRVKEEDVENVKAGVGIVLECLRRMNENLRTHGALMDSGSLRSHAETLFSFSSSRPPPAE